MNNGLTERDFELAFYLKSKDYKLEGLSFEKAKESGIQQIKKDGIQAQDWLDVFYPKEQRKEKKKLWIDEKNLIGSLDLSDFTELEELWCSRNKLTSLSSLGKKLEVIAGWDNNFSGDLSVFSNLTNLETLDISGSYFFGSLEPLKNLTKLRELDISNTDINSGLEYLPDSIKKIKCSSNQRKDAKIKIIAQELMKYKEDELQGDEGDDEIQLSREDELDESSDDGSFYPYELQEEESGYNCLSS